MAVESEPQLPLRRQSGRPIYGLGVDSIASLGRERLVVESVEWTSKPVRTGGPSGPVHLEWTLCVGVHCEVPVRAMAFLDVDGIRWHARDWARRAEPGAELEVSFFPEDWEHADNVQITAADGDISVQVDSAALRVDPVAASTLDVHAGTVGATGVPLSILRIPDAAIVLGILLIRSVDTRADPTRWRVRDEHVGGLGDFSFLATSQRAGRAVVSSER